MNRKFSNTFCKLFENGEGRLELVDPTNLLETGVEVMIRPGGKRFQPINLLSGGEKALSAIAVHNLRVPGKAGPLCLPR